MEENSNIDELRSYFSKKYLVELDQTYDGLINNDSLNRFGLSPSKAYKFTYTPSLTKKIVTIDMKDLICIISYRNELKIPGEPDIRVIIYILEGGIPKIDADVSNHINTESKSKYLEIDQKELCYDAIDVS